MKRQRDTVPTVAVFVAWLVAAAFLGAFGPDPFVPVYESIAAARRVAR